MPYQPPDATHAGFDRVQSMMPECGIEPKILIEGRRAARCRFYYARPALKHWKDGVVCGAETGHTYRALW